MNYLYTISPCSRSRASSFRNCVYRSSPVRRIELLTLSSPDLMESTNHNQQPRIKKVPGWAGSLWFASSTHSWFFDLNFGIKNFAQVHSWHRAGIPMNYYTTNISSLCRCGSEHCAEWFERNSTQPLYHMLFCIVANVVNTSRAAHSFLTRQAIAPIWSVNQEIIRCGFSWTFVQTIWVLLDLNFLG